MSVGVNDGNMEEGSLRCDANVSVREAGTDAFGTKAEIKNLNSFRFVEKAIDYEIARQIEALNGGARVVQETRLFDASTGRTYSMRSKEEAHDYRYFPDPDLPPLEASRDRVQAIREAMPELPATWRARLQQAYQLSGTDVATLTQARPSLGRYFEETIAAGADPKAAKNWAIGAISAKMNELGVDDVDPIRSRVAPSQLAGLLRLIDAGAISHSIGKDVFDKMFASARDCRRHCRRRRARADWRRLAHRRPDRGRARSQRGCGGAVSERENIDVRISRGPGDEGGGRKGQPQARQRTAEKSARRVIYSRHSN